MTKIVALFFSALTLSSLALATDDMSKMCEQFISEGSVSHVQEVSFPNPSAADYVKQFRNYRTASISKSEMKDLNGIAGLIKQKPANGRIYHAFNAFEDSVKPAEWESLYPSLNIVLNEKAQKVYTITDDEVQFAELLKKPNPNVEFVLTELSLVDESSPNAKMGRVMHTCYCYAYHLDTANALHCAYKKIH